MKEKMEVAQAINQLIAGKDLSGEATSLILSPICKQASKRQKSVWIQGRLTLNWKNGSWRSRLFQRMKRRKNCEGCVNKGGQDDFVCS